MNLLWSAASSRQLREARDFVAEDNADAAMRLVEQIEARAQALTEFPAMGRPMALGRRSLALPPTPFRLVYRERPGNILIIAVWHGAREWPFDTR